MTAKTTSLLGDLYCQCMKVQCTTLKNVSLSPPILVTLTHQQICSPQSSRALAEPQSTSWLIHHCLTYREIFKISPHCVPNCPRRHAKLWLFLIEDRVSSSLLCCYIKRNLSVSVCCFVYVKPQSWSAAWLNCPLQVRCKRLVILQIRFSCKMKNACLILMVKWN